MLPAVNLVSQATWLANNYLDGLVCPNPKWCVITHGFQSETSESIPDSTLGSCTMKHNPRVNEVVAQLPGIADIHPHQPEHQLQGLLSIYYEMQDMLAICAGMDAVTLQPVAGARVSLRRFAASKNTSATEVNTIVPRSSSLTLPTGPTLPVPPWLDLKSLKSRVKKMDAST